jgi:hypothetical protein
MRSRGIFLMLAAWAAAPAGFVSAQDKPALREMTNFMAKGALSELDREMARHPLSLDELEKAGLDGRPTPIGDVVTAMARYEKLRGRVAEPLQVRGDMHIGLTPNSAGEEAYTACFLSLTYNGLVFAGSDDELCLVRPESTRDVPNPRRKWDPMHILATRLFRLGYLAPDPILRVYQNEIGTREGNAVLVPKANVVIVIDTGSALEKLAARIDEEILAAMGDSAADGPADAGGPRFPSAGAIGSPDCIQFYLMAFARSREIPMLGSQRGTATKHYAEGNLWLSDRGYDALRQEYRRVNELIPIAREAVAEGWVDPRADRTLSTAAQRRREIRFGLVNPPPAADRARTTKKAARKKR